MLGVIYLMNIFMLIFFHYTTEDIVIISEYLTEILAVLSGDFCRY